MRLMAKQCETSEHICRKINSWNLISSANYGDIILSRTICMLWFIPSLGHILQVLKIVAMNAPFEGIIEPGLRWLSQELSEAENMPLKQESFDCWLLEESTMYQFLSYQKLNTVVSRVRKHSCKLQRNALTSLLDPWSTVAQIPHKRQN